MTKSETLNVNNELTTYFESKEEITEFYVKIIELYEDLEKRNMKNINFHIKPSSYSEYGDTYLDVIYNFEYERDLSEEEIKKNELKEKINLENQTITNQLAGKLSNNSIGSILHNEDLRQLYLAGKIKI